MIFFLNRGIVCRRSSVFEFEVFISCVFFVFFFQGNEERFLERVVWGFGLIEVMLGFRELFMFYCQFFVGKRFRLISQSFQRIQEEEIMIRNFLKIIQFIGFLYWQFILVGVVGGFCQRFSQFLGIRIEFFFFQGLGGKVGGWRQSQGFGFFVLVIFWDEDYFWVSYILIGFSVFIQEKESGLVQQGKEIMFLGNLGEEYLRVFVWDER